jgi:hypothetical protein
VVSLLSIVARGGFLENDVDGFLRDNSNRRRRIIFIDEEEEEKTQQSFLDDAQNAVEKTIVSPSP